MLERPSSPFRSTPGPKPSTATSTPACSSAARSGGISAGIARSSLRRMARSPSRAGAPPRSVEPSPRTATQARTPAPRPAPRRPAWCRGQRHTAQHRDHFPRLSRVPPLVLSEEQDPLVERQRSQPGMRVAQPPDRAAVHPFDQGQQAFPRCGERADRGLEVGILGRASPSPAPGAGIAAPRTDSDRVRQAPTTFRSRGRARRGRPA